jgi:preprotein translocase subunit SecF
MESNLILLAAILAILAYSFNDSIIEDRMGKYLLQSPCGMCRTLIMALLSRLF